MNNHLHIPLLPLHTVLFPGGPLPLKIFEARYLDMISDCLRREHGFGIALIRGGEETGGAAQTYEVGTLARIVDWDRREDGLLGIRVMGEQRFRILSRAVRPNQLVEVEAAPLPNESPQKLPAQFRPLAALLERLVAQVGPPYTQLPFEAGNATWISHRLAELLPMAFVQRQYLLELDDPLLRLKNLEEVRKTLNISE